MDIARGIDDVLAAVFPASCPCGAGGEPCCAPAVTPHCCGRPTRSRRRASSGGVAPGTEDAGVVCELVARGEVLQRARAVRVVGRGDRPRTCRADARCRHVGSRESRASRGSGVDHGSFSRRGCAPLASAGAVAAPPRRRSAANGRGASRAAPRSRSARESAPAADCMSSSWTTSRPRAPRSRPPLWRCGRPVRGRSRRPRPHGPRSRTRLADACIYCGPHGRRRVR